MSDREVVTSGMMDLKTTTAQDMLTTVVDMFDQAPPDSSPYLDVLFEDTWGQPRVMRMMVLGEKHGNNVH